MRGWRRCMNRRWPACKTTRAAPTGCGGRWAKALAEEAGVAHCLHFLDVSHAKCLNRITLRNARGEHPFTLSEAEFEHLAQYFVPPAEEEGMTILRYGERD